MSFTIPGWSAVIPGEFLVQLKKTYRTSRDAQVSMAPFRAVSKKNGVYLIKRPSYETVEGSLQTLSKIPGVAQVEPNRTWRLHRTTNDPVFERLWGLHNIGQFSSGESPSTKGVVGVDIDAIKAWDITTGSKKVKVAVIDTGVNYHHTDLEQNIWVNEVEFNGAPGVDDDNNGCVDDVHGCDFVNNDGDPMDDDGHGTHVAGTIGASANNMAGIVGVAWDVTLIPIKFINDQDYGATSDAIRAIDYAIEVGAQILSNSWGDEVESEFLKQAVERSRAAGALVVASAGNESSDNELVHMYPANYALDNVISVAAVDNLGELADFSNYSKTKVHIGAPGVNIMSTYFDPKAPLAYDSQSGTSMACPHVAGTAALMLAKNPKLTYQEIRKAIFDGARPLPGLRDKVMTGGMVNAYEALKLVP